MPLGIPHSRFLAWSADDQDKALAWALDKRARCSGCGTVSDSWVTHDGMPVVPPPYEPTHMTCEGCKTRDAYSKSLTDGGSLPAGVTVALKRANPDEFDEEFFTEPARVEVL